MSKKCVHNKRKYYCKECGGKGFCKHNKRKTYCLECNGGSICEHKKIKSRCKECKGGSICEHNKRKTYCLECNGGSICEHKKIKSRCKECKGGSICEHGNRRYACKKCDGNGICIHNIGKTYCKECNGSQICKHNKQKAYCKKCGGSSLCKSNFCEIRSNKKYDGYCTHCFAHLFPEDPRTPLIKRNSKEIKVVSHIGTKFEGFVHDKPIYVDLKGGCCDSKRRIDLRKLINGTMLCIEIDENQHKGYKKEDESSRYDNLFMDFSGKYIFIRYNPDKYKINEKNRNPLFKTRMNRLEQEIEKQIVRIQEYKNEELVEIVHLFYDEKTD